MRDYSEDVMKETRLALEENVLSWPRTSTKKIFGCPGYLADGKLFAMLVTNGIIIDERNTKKIDMDMAKRPGKKVVEHWVRVPLSDKKVLDNIMPLIRKSYEDALEGQ